MAEKGVGNTSMAQHFRDILDHPPAAHHGRGGDSATTSSDHAVTEMSDGFHIRPKELEEHLNQYVVDQADAVSVISTKVATHYNRMRFLSSEAGADRDISGNIKGNIIIIGPTGVGKTFIIKLIADYIGVPFVKADATKFSETGYVGGDVEDLIRELVRNTDGDVQKAEFGIVYIDEIDKIASSTGRLDGGLDVSRRGVQRNLLKLMEESEVDMRSPHDIASQVEVVVQMQRTGKADAKKISTKNVLFIVSGAFDGLRDVIFRRLRSSGIGFADPSSDIPDMSEADVFRHVQTEDLVKYGFESEFIGRLPVIATLQELGLESLYRILKNPHCSVVLSKKLDFEAYGIHIEFSDDALRYFAEQASTEQVGARGLTRIIEKALLPFEKELPSSSVKHLLLTKDAILEADVTLKKAIQSATLEDFAASFYAEHKVRVSFTPEARDIITKAAEESGIGEDAYCRNNFASYEYGLKLIGIQEFEITGKAAQDPSEYLDNLVKDAYEKKKMRQSTVPSDTGTTAGDDEPPPVNAI